MNGTIMVEGLEIICIVGILPREREEEQRILVDVEMDYDFAAAAASENVKDTVDYVDMANYLTSLAREKKYQLIETYAEEAAAGILDRFGGTRVALKIMKPAAIPAAKWTAVRLERHA